MNYDGEVKLLLEQLHDRYNRCEFIAADPISIPHRFSRREDIEISGFLAATIAWGNRKAIVKSAERMIGMMGGVPFEFTMQATDSQMNSVTDFVHRTFNGIDFRDFIFGLRHIYRRYGSMGTFFERRFAERGDLRTAISAFRREFFAVEHAPRCEKHLSSVDGGSACKRLNMFLRWMVRRDDRGVDFGLWRGIPMSALYLPLDVHSAATARSLRLLTRRQNDWRAVEEVTAALRGFDAEDPIRYDFSLFGAGMSGLREFQLK